MKLERNGLSKIGAVSKSCPQTFGMWSVEGLFLDCILLYQAKAWIIGKSRTLFEVEFLLVLLRQGYFSPGQPQLTQVGLKSSAPALVSIVLGLGHMPLC